MSLSPRWSAALNGLRTAGPPRSGQGALAQVLDVHVVVEAVARSLAAVARFLHAAERRGLRRERTFVDADDAAFERVGHPPDACDILRVEVGRQAKGRVVGEGYHLGLVVV